MKQILLSTIFCLGFSLAGQAQSSEKAAVKERILQFASAADSQDATALQNLLDPHFQILMNQLFGSQEVVALDKSTYLNKIRNKEFGGEKRTVKIQQVLLNGNTATAKVLFQGQKMTFSSLLGLVKNKDGVWQIVTDMPVIQ